jgi:hypothetical protein
MKSLDIRCQSIRSPAIVQTVDALEEFDVEAGLEQLLDVRVLERMRVTQVLQVGVLRRVQQHLSIIVYVCHD